MPTDEMSLLRFTTAGSVDDGKSTLIGRLLYDSRNLYEDHLKSLREEKKETNPNGNIDFALVTDGLKAEREQNITIDVAYRYFTTPKRKFILADTPGHEQYTRNMVTGASTADLALILIDAQKGVQTQTKRHAFITSLLGIPRVFVIVNKMDLIQYNASSFEEIRRDFIQFSRKLKFSNIKFIPISALNGDNVVTRSSNMPWFQGQSVLESLESVYIENDRNLRDFRFPVQMVIRPFDGFRGYAGQIASGTIYPGEAVQILPSGRQSKIKQICTLEGDLREAHASQSVVLTLEDECDISRGDMIVRPCNQPFSTNTFEATLIWLSDQPLEKEKFYRIKHTTRWTQGRIESIRHHIDVNTLRRRQANELNSNEIARVLIKTSHALFLDEYEKNKTTGSFILVHPDNNQTVAAGLVLQKIPFSDLEKLSLITDSKRHKRQTLLFPVQKISQTLREKKQHHPAFTLWLTGLSGSGKSTIARLLEESFFKNDKTAFFLDGDRLRTGLCSDLGFSKYDRKENVRRVAEVAKLFNEAGVIAIVALISPFEKDREEARKTIGIDRFIEVFIDTPLAECEKRDVKGLYQKARTGEIAEFTGISSPYEAPQKPDIHLSPCDDQAPEDAVNLIFRFLEKKFGM